ncbi:MAG TPA: FtsX-like permease family protein [Mucilaginibacter sp.]|nr:FtsX-like permease family protein [Mucilaginibacter sp.]
MFKNYLKTAFRSFKRHKLFTFINVIGLAIGISAALVIFLIVYHDFTFDKFHKDGNRIYRVVSDYSYAGDAFYNSGVTGPLPEAIKDDVTGVEVSAPVYSDAYNVLIPAKTQKKFKSDENIVYVDKRYFDLFSYKWIVGSPKVLSESRQVVLASQQAKKYFPSLSYSEMIGKQVVYADTIRTTVAGIVEEFKENSDLTFTDFISNATIQTIPQLKQQQDDWTSTNGNSMCFVKLTTGSSVSSIEKQLAVLKAKYNPPPKGGQGYQSKWRLQPLANIHFNEHYGAINNTAANKTTLYFLMAIAGFLLALGCINFINLTTAQASQRAKEIGIRKTMGGTRSQLVGQFLSETTLITIFAVIISIVMSPFIIKLFSNFISKDVKLDMLGNPSILVFIILLIIIVSFISGFYPAMVLSKFKPVLVLKSQAHAGTSKTRNAFLRKSLTVTQFVIAQFFIMATILVSKQIYYVLHTDLGFRKNAIVYIDLPWKQKTNGLGEVFANKVKALPQVEMVSLGNDPPSTNGWSSNDAIFRNGKREVHTELYRKKGDENYIKLYGIKLLAGRNIRQSDTTTGMLVNANYAHLIGFKNVADALGKTVDFGKNHKQIVGVVADFHQASLHAPIKAISIMPDSYRYGVLHIALKPETAGGNDWNTALAGIQQAWKDVFPGDDYAYHFFDESIAKMYDKEQNTSKLLTWATGLSIFISCLGLLGLAIFTTNLRTKEIGVRKVLGATVAQIVTLLSRELVLLVLLAFVIVTPLAVWAMNKWMQNFADHTSLSWWVFVLSGAGMLLTALITLSSQTIRAATANPVKSLRSE